MRVLVAKEKHGTRMIDAEDIGAAALKLLTERFEEGYWYLDPEQEEHPFSLKLREERDALLALPDEEVAKLPDAVKRERARAEADLAEDKRQHEEYEEIKRAIEERDGDAAWRILQSRREHEYEYVELDEVERAAV